MASTFWSLIPPILTISIALWRKDIVIALFAGIVSCSIIANGWGFVLPIADKYFTSGLSEHTSNLLMLLMFGPFLAALKRSGGFSALASLADRKLKNGKSAKMLTWLLAICCCDQTTSAIGIGSVMRPVTDRHKVPHEKLGFILSSSGIPFCAIAPFTIYILFYSGLINEIIPSANGVYEYLKAIPFNFFAIISIVVALLYAAELIPDFGYMKKCEERARTTGMLIREGSHPLETKEIDEIKPVEGIKLDVWTFFLPFIVFFSTIIFLYLSTGEIQIISPFFLGMLTAIIYPIIRGYFKAAEITDIVINGIKGAIPSILILILAFSFSAGISDVGLSVYIIEISKGLLIGSVVPAASFLICALTSFTTGSLVSGLLILAPISLTLASSLDANLTLTIAACLAGSMFGDESSPVSDMIVCSAMGAGVDVVDLAKAQLPYKLIIGSISLLLYVVLGFIM